MEIFLLVNPSAGGGKAEPAAREAGRVLEAGGASVRTAVSKSAQDLTRLTREAVEGGVDRVVVVGGDGTWHFALNGLAHSNIPTALIPCGRGNDFSRNLDIPLSPSQAAEIALKDYTVDLDLVWAENRYYIGIGGVGFDSEVTECANTRIPAWLGDYTYTAAVFYKLLSFKPKYLKIVHDHGVFEGLVMFAVFANSNSYGCGMKIAPEARMDDGMIDVVIIEKVGLPVLLKTLPKVFSGKHLPHPNIRTFRTTRAVLTSPDKMDLYGDAEYITSVPLTLEIRPKALRVLAPEPR